MSHARRAIKALGLGLMAALSVMAFMAVSAQAATVLESGTGAIKADKNFKIIQDSTHYLLHSEVGIGTKILILCGELTGSGVIKPDATDAASFSFKKCETELNGVKSMVCLPKEPISASVTSEVYLHKLAGAAGPEETTLISPTEAGLRFTTVKLDKEPGCAIGPNFEVKGHAIVLECKKALLTDQVTHLFEQVTGTSHDLVGHENSLKFGTKAAQILGSYIIELESQNTWAIHV